MDDLNSRRRGASSLSSLTSDHTELVTSRKSPIWKMVESVEVNVDVDVWSWAPLLNTLIPKPLC